MFTRCVSLRAQQGAAPVPERFSAVAVRPHATAKARWLSIRRLQLLFLLFIAAIFASSVRGAPPPANIAPAILSFEAVHIMGQYWEFRGEIDDEDPAGCVVNFGTLFVDSVNVDIDGTFSFVKMLGVNEEGVVSAQAVDAGGLASGIEERTVVQ